MTSFARGVGRGVGVACAVALLLASRSAAAETKALTDLDDARACAILPTGGFAVATGGGLAIVKSDGSTIRVTSLDGLPETRVHAVAAQPEGIWVGTEAGAAFVGLDGKVARTVGTWPVSAVRVANDGTVVLGTRGSGVFKLGVDAKPKLLETTTPSTRVTAITELRGVLHVAWADGPLTRFENNALRPVANTSAHGQAVASTGEEVLLGGLEGLQRISDRGVVTIGSVDARGIAAVGPSILVATFGTGVLSGAAKGTLRPVDGIPRFARGVDMLGTQRCAATTEGLFVDEGKGTFRRIALGALPSNDVTALAASPSGRVAIGTFESGAVIRENGASKPIAGIDRTETINGLVWQGTDRLWIASVHGLVRVAIDSQGRENVRRFTAHDGLPSTFTRSLHVLADGKLLVGTEAGPAIVDGEKVTPLLVLAKGTAQALTSPMHATWAVASSANGTLFIGTASGLYWGREGRFERVSLATGELQDDWVTALAVDGNDVFVGTYAKGVTRLTFDTSDKKARPSATHLGGGYVNPDGLLVAKGKLYASSMDHLLVRAKDDSSASWERKKALAPGRDVTAARFVGTEMWVASRRGIGVDNSP